MLVGLILFIVVLLPLATVLSKSFRGRAGEFVGLANYMRYFADPALSGSLANSLTVALVTTAITIPIAFAYAYALTRCCIPAKGLFKVVSLVPLLAPSLLPGLSIIYLFGNKGILKGLLFGESIYGPIGIILGEVFFALPHALIVLLSALGAADQRLYDAAQALRASHARVFFTVTLPGCRYGLISATFVVFTIAFTDFGVPTVVGGDYNVLATDIYKHVVGQFNFEMGAVVGMILLGPAALSFVADRIVRRRQRALLTAGVVAYRPRPRALRDATALLICSAVAVFLLGILAMAAFASFVAYWPYDLSFTWSNYDFGRTGLNGWGAYANSLTMATWTALVGTAVIFSGAYLIEKSRGFERIRSALHLLCMVPLAVPGLVLGISYVLFFNDRDNPAQFLYLTMPLLVICTIAHFYTVCHLTAVTALKQLDAEFEAVSASLKVAFYRTFWRVTVPVCLPAILDIAVYLFVNAMTTVSAVIFLYSAQTRLAAIAVLTMDEMGKTASAMAMGLVIVATSAGLRGLQALLSRGLIRRTQAWRHS